MNPPAPKLAYGFRRLDTTPERCRWFADWLPAHWQELLLDVLHEERAWLNDIVWLNCANIVTHAKLGNSAQCPPTETMSMSTPSQAVMRRSTGGDTEGFGAALKRGRRPAAVGGWAGRGGGSSGHRRAPLCGCRRSGATNPGAGFSRCRL